MKQKILFWGLLALGAVLIVVGLMFRDPAMGLVFMGAGGLIIVGTALRVGRRVSSHRRDRLIEMQANAAQRGDIAFLSDPVDGSGPLI